MISKFRQGGPVLELKMRWQNPARQNRSEHAEVVEAVISRLLDSWLILISIPSEEGFCWQLTQ